MSSVRIFGGRFQPFHSGHLWVVKALVNNWGGCILGIVNPEPLTPPDGTYPSFVPARNPLTYWERAEMIHDTLQDAGIEPAVDIIPLKHPRARIEREEAFLPSRRTWVVPPLDDHELQKISDLKRQGESVDVIDVPQEISTIRASQVRQCLRIRGLECAGACKRMAVPCYPHAVGEVITEMRLDLRLHGSQLSDDERDLCPRFVAAAESELASKAELSRLELEAVRLIGLYEDLVDASYDDPRERQEAKASIRETHDAARKAQSIESYRGVCKNIAARNERLEALIKRQRR